MGIKVQRQEDQLPDFGIDKIPIKEIKEDPITSTYKLGMLDISPCEYANAFKINDIIDALQKMQARLTKLENR